MEGFGQSAQKLARNPLGIIALFIVLVYGIAGLVLGVASSSLEASERQLLIWFLVVFPIVVLAVFFRLVTKHHVKLYAPHDFPDSDGFFRMLTPSEQREKLNQEIREIEAISSTTNSDEDVASELDRTGVSRELSSRQAWVLAEEFAIREIESEFDTSIQRNVSLGSRYVVDGILLDKGRIIVVEIKFIKKIRVLRVVRSAVEQLGKFAEALHPRPSFIIAIVSEGVSGEDLENQLVMSREYLKAASFPIELRVYDFDELKKKYGVTP